jgi:two-component system chemotaxis sensor kinase CheA
MSIDLTQFHAAFYEESFEAIASMEQALLGLDVGTADAESINTIFRVAHSIKGGAATFGFSEITSFTHSLENLLDQLRSRRMRVTSSLSDLLLRSVDVMRELLRAQQRNEPIDAQRVADLQFDLELAVAQQQRTAAAPIPGPAPAPGPASATAAPGSDGLQRYRISFRPLAQLLERGNDPLRLFRELRALGSLQVTADLSRLPALAALNPQQCYLSWLLELRTAAPRTAIAEVFDWAMGDCELQIIALDEPAANAAAHPGAATGLAVAAAGAVVAPAADAAAASSAAEAAAAAAEEHGAHARGQASRGAEVARSADATSIRVSVEKIDDLMNSVGELVITQSMLGQYAPQLEGALGERLRAGLAQLDRNVRELQESVMRVRMVPISFVFSRFPRMVHDLGRRLGKQVELKLTGADTELDKTVLEKIGDPLVHLVRNSIDHGIETAQERRAAGKSECGLLHLHAYHRGSSITVEVSDDGGGLKRERIVAKARERGLIGPDEQPDDEAICNLIFMAGFSTVDQATDVSGRGVGMDVVKGNVESLGGSIEVRSVEGQGARFIITLPLTLAIVDGQTVAVGQESYIVPLTAIVESLQMRNAQVKQVVGHGEVLSFRGEYLPVLRLQRLFGCGARPADAPPSDDAAADAGLIMVVEGEGRRVGLVVDELLGQQQVVVKTLETNYGHVDGIAGATILGNGSVALILDIGSLTRRVAERLAA